MGVIESELMLQMKLGYMQSYASIHAHPQSKVSDAFKEFKMIYGDVKATVPYVTMGRGATEQLHDERMDLVKEYEAMRAKERPNPQPPKPSLHVVDAKSKR
jgi:hypothetical protein